MAAVFWTSGFLLFFAFAGYPALIAFLAAVRPRPPARSASFRPRVSILLAARDEAHRLVARARNLLRSDYPPESLEVIIVSDGSSDRPADALAQLDPEERARVRLIERPVPEGKPACLNAAAASASGEVFVFADARQEFACDAIARLVDVLADPAFVAASGSLSIGTAVSATGRGVDAYWRLEKFLRAREALFDSCIGCTGAIYAMRRDAWHPLPHDTVLDDVVAPMLAAEGGGRVWFEPAARAFDPQPLEPARERNRKARTLAGNYQMLFRYPRWILPWKCRLWWMVLSHKILRLFGPFLLLALLVSNAALVWEMPYKVFFAAQMAFYTAAAAGARIPAGFAFLNLTALSGLWLWLRGGTRAGPWK